MKIAVLDADTIGDDIDLSPLEEFGELSVFRRTESEEIETRLQKFDVLCLNKVQIKRPLPDSVRTRLICLFATGTDNVDLVSLRNAGIGVCNVSGYSTDSVAQHTLFMVLSLLHQGQKHHEYILSGEWSRSGLFTTHQHPFFELKGKTWGLVGMGRIGRAVAKLAEAFGCRVQWCSVSGNSREEGYPQVVKEELFSTSDVISLHCPLTEKSQGYVDEKALGAMKDRGILVNVARGAVVDVKALVAAMHRKNILAGLDVFSREPLKEESLLLKSDFHGRLLLSPHIAWASIEARNRVIEETRMNIQSFLASQGRNRV